jgi:hypothetical protein
MIRPSCATLCGALQPYYVIPDLESMRTLPPVRLRSEAVPPGTEEFADRPEGGEEALGMAS